jgi:uncharacterized protein
MFGGPIGKLLVLIAVVAAVWYGWKYVTRINQLRTDERRRTPRRETHALDAEDTKKCRVCGAYVTEGAQSCGRSDCPYPR